MSLPPAAYGQRKTGRCTPPFWTTLLMGVHHSCWCFWQGVVVELPAGEYWTLLEQLIPRSRSYPGWLVRAACSAHGVSCRRALIH